MVLGPFLFSSFSPSIGPTHEPLLKSITRPFQRLQQALLRAPALHLPDLTHPFFLYVTEKEGFALGALGHQIGPSFAPVAYLSKKLDLCFLKSITASCKICQTSNSNSRYRGLPFPTHQARGSLPGTDWQLDFTHMPTVRRVKYLLVLVDTFSGWVEAFPTTNERAQSVSDLLREIIP